jgi:hypothetical protein
MSTQTLASYLKTAGVNVAPAAAPAKVAAAPAPAPAAPVKAAAAPAPAKPVEQPKAAAAPAQPQADVLYNPAAIKTAEQKWLLENQGILVLDPAKAAALVGNFAKTAEATKKAELDKFAAEMEARGVLQFHGMMKESCAMQLASGEARAADVIKTAAWVGCSVQDIIKRANELKKIAELAAASGEAAFFGSERGRAARTDDSEVMRAAERNQNTTAFEPEAVSGTRAATRGTDGKELRFQETVTMPNNPGLNHGQQTDNGKSGV